MKFYFILFSILLLSSCSHQKSNNFTIAHYKDEKNSPLKIHRGHFINPFVSKTENEKILYELQSENYDIVNLSLEDLITTENQQINLENYSKLVFLNSSIIDATTDQLFKTANTKPYIVDRNTIYIGISDQKFSSILQNERFLVSDYIASIFKIKKQTKELNLNDFILIHHLGSEEINEVFERLPPQFINSLAN
jgi:hypothetical protein